MEQMPYQEQPYDAAPRPAPLLWIGLTFFFALCCCFFFIMAGVEAVFLLGGTGVGAATTGTPTLSNIEFYLAQKSSTEPSGEPITEAPAGTKTIYAYFTYKNMPKTGLKWSYEWRHDDEPLDADSKFDIAWSREGNGVFSVRLSSATALKAGDYELLLKLGNKEMGAATVAVAER